jgi:hypothetical protein
MNFEALTDELSDLYRDLKAGKIEPALAHELNNTALNIQGTIRLGLLNAKLRNEAPDLKFFRKAKAEATQKDPKNG